MSKLVIRGLHASVLVKADNGDEVAKEILKGVDLEVESGKVYAIMGPNGSGKSTLAYTLAGHPKYVVTSGTAELDGKDLLQMTVDERAKSGLFLAMQYPIEVPGVSVTNFLRTAKTALDGKAPQVREFIKDLNSNMQSLKMDKKFANRSLNEGFSGGEKKRNEILQLKMLQPKIAILDETDSGLDVDALKIVSKGVNDARKTTDLGVLLITHYYRILDYITPDEVFVFADGKVVDKGDAGLAKRLEETGYDKYVDA
ncbi:MAG: Fe-S cluster assembly ATPase SufC [Bifidobacteriaceae bacterium]|jgi:Fe-S cluster assembly ATP-binding protein|nr:Fe-S cluster assembly ATPase SufC [Bifidobacteriaceae bacterium]